MTVYAVLVTFILGSILGGIAVLWYLIREPRIPSPVEVSTVEGKHAGTPSAEPIPV